MSLLKQSVKSGLRWGLNTISPLFSRKSSLEPAAAREQLLAVCPDPEGTVKADNQLLTPTVDLQIIIPAYNAEAYLDVCMDSVLSQKTEYSFHVILIDDGSRDNTPAICDRFAEHPQVSVIHQKNSGPAAARNAGLATLFGRYIMFVDSDDLLCPGAIQAMLDTAFRHDCDIVEGSMDYLSPEGKSIAYQHTDPQRIFDPYLLQGYPCGKVFKARLFRNIRFPEGYWYEDSIISFLISPSAETIRGIPDIVYRYRVNQSGLTVTTHGRPKAADTYWITELLMQEHRNFGIPETDGYFRSVLQQFRLNQHRVAELSDEVQEAVFILSCELLTQYFPQTATNPAYKALLRALRNKDFGAFKVCCRLL